METLRFLREQAGEFTDQTRRVASSTDKMVSAFSDDKREFTECAVEINSMVGGESGILGDLARDLEDVNSKITLAAVGAGVSRGLPFSRVRHALSSDAALPSSPAG
ncbi:hypothetical protein SBADM41S_06899 [Streptomyces badius]